MAQLNLIPGYGDVADQDQDQLNLVPGFGDVKESVSEESPTGSPWYYYSQLMTIMFYIAALQEIMKGSEYV